MAQNTGPNAKIRDIVRRKVTESTHRVIKKLSGQRRKRKRDTSAKRGGGKVKKAKKKLPARGSNKSKTKKKNIKRDIFSSTA